MELSEDSRLLECKICKETKFTFHESIEINNPENDTYEDIKNVYECNVCGALHFTINDISCVQIYMNIHTNKHVPNLTLT